MSNKQNKTQSQPQQGDQDVQDKDKLATTGAVDDAERADEATGDQSGEQGDSESGSDSEGTGEAGAADEGQDAEALAALAALSQQGQDSGEASDEGSDDAGDDTDADGGEDTDSEGDEDQGEASDEPEAPINDAPAVDAAPAQENKPTVADAPNNAPVAAPTARIQPVTLNPVPVKVDVKAQQDNLKLTIIASQLQQYADEMGPGKIVTAVNGKTAQTGLWRTIEQVLKLEGPEFIKGYTMLLDWTAENRKGCMNDRVVYRFFGELTISDTDRRNFNRMINLITATADPATRRLGLEQVGLEATLAGFRDGAIQQRVSEFYSL